MKGTALAFLAFIALANCQNSCRLTTRDVEGPFYERGSPVTNRIVPDGDLKPSTRISLGGRVLDRRCRPISNAAVDVWYAGGNPGKVPSFAEHLCPIRMTNSLKVTLK